MARRVLAIATSALGRTQLEEAFAAIKAAGGVAIVQDPGTATRRAMPDAAIAAAEADAILPLEEIPKFLHGLCCP
jgi:chemotaxis response regulator CheB